MEACTGAWALHQVLRGVAKRVEIIDPHAFRERFPKKGKKTDRRDAHNLARYVKEEHGGIWVPDEVTRHRRQLSQLRESTNKMLTQAKNAVHAALKEHHVSYRFLSSSLWTQKARRWLSESVIPRLSLASQIAVNQNLSIIDLLSGQLRELEAIMAAELEQSPEMQIIASHPGIGVVSAYVMMAEIGDIKRFHSPKNLASFAGIAPGVSQTGGPGSPAHTFWVTRQGRSRLRWIAVECALSATKGCDQLRNLYNRLVRRTKIKGKALVAVGHKLLIHVWHMLTKGEPYNKLDPVKHAKKVSAWRKLAATYTGPTAAATPTQATTRGHLLTCQSGSGGDEHV
jgi:transposase